MDKNLVISGELRALRAKKGISQRELASAIGVNPSTVSAWENRAGIGFADAWKLADFYGVPLDVLAGRKAG